MNNGMKAKTQKDDKMIVLHQLRPYERIEKQNVRKVEGIHLHNSKSMLQNSLRMHVDRRRTGDWRIMNEGLNAQVTREIWI